MRVTVIEFGMNVAFDVAGQLPDFKRKFEAHEHTLEWLPEEQVLVIDGWRHTPSVGTRWKVEEPDYFFSKGDTDPRALPTDDTGMFQPIVHKTREELREMYPDPKGPDAGDQPSAAAGPARRPRRKR